MRLNKILAAGILTSFATAQMLLGSTLRNIRGRNGDHHKAKHLPRNLHNVQSQPMSARSIYSRSNSTDLPPFKAGTYTVKQQDNTTCATYGESQWTGTVDVTDERRLFFWFFDSRNDPKNDPIVFWINGGPGGSSMIGLFTEMGPCVLETDAKQTSPNEWAWNNNASLLFIDQPAGVGFASLAEGAPLPNSDADGAKDFQAFLNVFFGSIFPERAHLPIHFAAESYGGHYAPTYVNHILESRRYDSKTAFWGNITSIILVNAVVDFIATNIGVYEVLCTEFHRLDSEPKGNVLNETACEAIRLALPECERLSRSCDLSYDGAECLGGFQYCSDKIGTYYNDLVVAGTKSPYNIHKDCIDPPLCGEANKGNHTAYLNQDYIKSALNFPDSFVFQELNVDINQAYNKELSQFKPTTRELGAVLDAYKTTKLGDVKLLVLQGNADYTCNTPGNMWMYEKMIWSGQADYRVKKWEEMPQNMACKGFWKATPDGRFAFVAVDGAGHTVPGDAAEGTYRILQRWIDGGWHM